MTDRESHRLERGRWLGLRYTGSSSSSGSSVSASCERAQYSLQGCQQYRSLWQWADGADVTTTSSYDNWCTNCPSRYYNCAFMLEGDGEGTWWVEPCLQSC